jgi:ABC-2 type transport system ATP-binding protein
MTTANSTDQDQAQTVAANDIVIRTSGATMRFGHQTAIEDVSFQVRRGSIFGFIGPSGSGKTTTVRLLTGFYKPVAGQVSVLEMSPSDFKQSTRARIGYMTQHFALYPELTVWENLNFAASIYGMSYRREPRLNQLLEFVELTDHKRKLARNLSGGMKRRLSLAATLVHNPRLLFLDEPTAGIDPVLRRKFWDHFKTLQREGRTLIITTQYVGEAAYCDRVGVMARGHLLLVDTPEGLRRHAYGGELVDLRTEERLTFKDLRVLGGLPFVQDKVTRLEDGHTVRLVVDEASTAIPALLEWCRQEYVTVESIEQCLPPVDDVFVELVKDVPGNE